MRAFRTFVWALTIQFSVFVGADFLEDNILAKIYGVATKGADSSGQISAPYYYPEYVPGTGTTYVYNYLTDWTAGFLPGSLWLLYQRSLSRTLKLSPSTLLQLARTWEQNLISNKERTDTHDLGFMMHDSFGWDAILTGNETAKSIVYDSAISLSQRFNPTVGAIRSWGSLTDTGSFQVIIDNMMNLEMLYWVASTYSNTTLSDIATTHATTTMVNHFRANYSTWHVVNYNQNTGAVISKYTNQGYADWSTWARGQAWAGYGFVSAYNWTGNATFLYTAKKAFDYFLAALPADGVPYWDFDAPLPGPRDTSAAMIVASGLLFLIEADPSSSSTYLSAAQKLISDTIALSLSPEAVYTTSPFTVTSLGGFDSVLMNGTIDNNPAKTHTDRSSNTGIVYGDYFLIEAQNRLLKMGLL
ncbi:hypothetical protein RUND412_002612 [Rhizina undulata]